MQKAIDKLKSEIEKESKNPYVKMIGEYLIGYVQQNPAASEALTNPNKTILKSLDAMKKKAQKNQSNGIAMMTGEEGYKVVREYFGIKDSDGDSSPVQSTAQNSQPIIYTSLGAYL